MLFLKGLKKIYGLKQNILLDKNMLYMLEMIASIFYQYIFLFRPKKAVELLECLDHTSQKQSYVATTGTV